MKKNNNDFYDRISKKEPNIPSSFYIRDGQMKSLKDNSTDLFDLIVKTFTFGYMQGRRAEKNEREKIISNMEPKKIEIVNLVNRLDSRKTRIVYMFLVGLIDQVSSDAIRGKGGAKQSERLK